MRYDQFEMLFDTWQGFQRAVHTISPMHPMKKYYDSLFAKIKELPVKKQKEYFDEYFNKNRLDNF